MGTVLCLGIADNPRWFTLAEFERVTLVNYKRSLAYTNGWWGPASQRKSTAITQELPARTQALCSGSRTGISLTRAHAYSLNTRMCNMASEWCSIETIFTTLGVNFGQKTPHLSARRSYRRAEDSIECEVGP